MTADPTASEKLDERMRTRRYLWQAIRRDHQRRNSNATSSLSSMLELMRKLRANKMCHMAILRWAGQPTTPPPDFDWNERKKAIADRR